MVHRVAAPENHLGILKRTLFPQAPPQTYEIRMDGCKAQTMAWTLYKPPPPHDSNSKRGGATNTRIVLALAQRHTDHAQTLRLILDLQEMIFLLEVNKVTGLLGFYRTHHKALYNSKPNKGMQHGE